MACMGSSQNSMPLHKAARRGNEDEAILFLRQGADVTARDAEGRTPLHLAVMRGHMGIIQRLLEHGGPAVLLSRDILSCTPVHLAAVQNQVQLITMLIEALLQDTGGCTPLHEVARRGCMQDFMGFLHLGWDLASCDDRNQDALQLTEDSLKPGIAQVQQILGWSELHLAAMEGQTSHIEELVQSGALDLHVPSANSWTPLHYAAAYNQVDSIATLIQLGAKVDVQDSVGSTPLHVACGEGHMSAVTKLIESGCDPSVKDCDGCTPLYCAAAWNQIGVVRHLHSLGCSSWVQSEEGRTVTHVAAEQGWVELLEVLINELGCEVDSRDTYKFTPLHSAANWGWGKAIHKLVELKHEVDVKDYLGRTPLHYAALHGRSNVIEDLVKLGASLHEVDDRGGFTPLHLAADAGQCEAVAKLVALGAEVEAQTAKGWTSLQLANMRGPVNVDVLGLLVELGANVDVVKGGKNLETPLHIAARAGRLDIVQKLIDCGVSVTTRTKDGSTALHYAAAFGQAHVLEALVKAGSDARTRDNALNTPLHLAAGCGFMDAVVKLVELGGDLNSRDMSDCTPLQNTAHGTYSALAQMPHGVSAMPNGHLQGLGSLSLRRSGLTSAMLPSGSMKDGDAPPGGMVPVRTGFAWTTLGRPTHSWNGAELMSLLRKATRSRQAGNLLFGSDFLHHPKAEEFREDEDEWDGWSQQDLLEKEREGLEVLLKKTETLQLNQMEQDRSRLIPVAEKMVELGADISATDNEGRTALHLAAGCGDKSMVMKLVELGLDINCKDGVGGTPMHHAAMANKKEMMFMLARLGTDWRAKAEGIDGATAAFVLCGQHGKSTRQQKLLEAKLKRVYHEGEQGRRAGRNPFEIMHADGREEEVAEEDLEELTERADANMAALLEEEAKAAIAGRKRKKKNRRRSKVAEGSVEALNSDRDLDQVHSSVDIGLEKGSKVLHDKGGEKSTAAVIMETGSRMQEEDCSTGHENDSHQASKGFLEETVVCANTVLEIGAATGRDAILDVLHRLDEAVLQATQANIGAKYARKIRKRLQALLDEDMRSENVEAIGRSEKGSREVDESNLGEGWKRVCGSGNGSGGNNRSSGFSHIEGSPGRIQNESEWHHVGPHGKRSGFSAGNGVMVVPRTSQGSRSGQASNRSHGRRSSQGVRSEVRSVRSSTSVMAAGSVVVRTGNVVVVKAAAQPSGPLLHSSSGSAPRSASTPSCPPPGPTKPAWKHGVKQKPVSSVLMASDPEFPPLQSSASGSSATRDQHDVPGGEPNPSPPSSSMPIPAKKGTSSGPWPQPMGLAPKTYELFGDNGRLAGPRGLSTGSPMVHSPSGSVWCSRSTAGSPYGISEPVAIKGSARSFQRPSPGPVDMVPPPPGMSDTVDPSCNGSSAGIPIPFPAPYPGQHCGPYGGMPQNGMVGPGMGQGNMWQGPMPFASPAGYSSVMSSSLGAQVMGGPGHPFGLSPPLAPHMHSHSQGTNYNHLMHQQRFQPPPPPPPGPPPQLRGDVPGYGSFTHTQYGSDRGLGMATSIETGGSLPMPVQEVDLEQIELLAVEGSSEEARLVSRHLLGELETEIGI